MLQVILDERTEYFEKDYDGAVVFQSCTFSIHADHVVLLRSTAAPQTRQTSMEFIKNTRATMYSAEMFRSIRPMKVEFSNHHLTHFVCEDDTVEHPLSLEELAARALAFAREHGDVIGWHLRTYPQHQCHAICVESPNNSTRPADSIQFLFMRSDLVNVSALTEQGIRIKDL